MTTVKLQQKALDHLESVTPQPTWPVARLSLAALIQRGALGLIGKSLALCERCGFESRSSPRWVLQK